MRITQEDAILVRWGVLALIFDRVLCLAGPDDFVNHGLQAGRCPRNGFFVPPTVLRAKSPDTKIWREEVFGPVLTVLTFQDEAQALALANDNEFGLAAAVFTPDEAQMRRVTRSLKCGIVWENCSQPCFCQAPWGGRKKSGIGRDLGTFGLHNYMEPKQVGLPDE